MWSWTALLLGCFLSTSVLAQQAQRVTLDSGTVVRLHWNDVKQKVRLLAPLGPDSTLVRYCHYPSPVCGVSTSNPPQTRSINDLTRVEMRRGSRTGRGALIGAGVGAVGSLLMLLGYSLSDRPAPSTEQVVVTFTLITAAWSGLGALVGGSSDNWEAVW